jgi:hypothetical protein
LKIQSSVRGDAGYGTGLKKQKNVSNFEMVFKKEG